MQQGQLWRELREIKEELRKRGRLEEKKGKKNRGLAEQIQEIKEEIDRWGRQVGSMGEWNAYDELDSRIEGLIMDYQIEIKIILEQAAVLGAKAIIKKDDPYAREVYEKMRRELVEQAEGTGIRIEWK